MNTTADCTETARLQLFDEQLGMAVSHDCWTLVDYIW